MIAGAWAYRWWILAACVLVTVGCARQLRRWDDRDRDRAGRDLARPIPMNEARRIRLEREQRRSA